MARLNTYKFLWGYFLEGWFSFYIVYLNKEVARDNHSLGLQGSTIIKGKLSSHSSRWSALYWYHSSGGVVDEKTKEES